MDTIERTAKTVDEAVAEALKFLDCTAEEAEITVLEEATRGFLGIGAKPARVRVTRKYDPALAAKRFIREISAAMNIAITPVVEIKDKYMYISIIGDDLGILIGKHGQTLDALQYLINLVVNKNSESYISVILDAENYRQRRKETLEALAHNLAKKVKQTKRNVVLEPMNPHERRIIHSCLQNDRFVTTYSEGTEPYRNVVITLKK